MSFRDFPFLKEISGGSLKISRRKGWFCIKCHFSIKTCLRLGTLYIVFTSVLQRKKIFVNVTFPNCRFYDAVASNVSLQARPRFRILRFSSDPTILH